MVLGLDEGIQNVTEAAAEHLGDNTLIVVVSDNGGSTWFGGMNYPFRGSKTTPMEGGVRVPAFAYDLSPDKRYLGAGGRVFQGMFHVSDWFPTLAGMAGLPIPAALRDAMDGMDMHVALKEGSEGPRTEFLVDMYYGSEGEFLYPAEDLASYRMGKWKLIEGVVRDPNWCHLYHCYMMHTILQ
jgi:arylsulfatase A-like enzyme